MHMRQICNAVKVRRLYKNRVNEILLQEMLADYEINLYGCHDLSCILPMKKEL